MAIQKNPNDKDATSAYTVLRPFYWGGDVAGVGAVLQLTKAQAAELQAANKVTPGEPVPVKASKATKATNTTQAPAPGADPQTPLEEAPQ